MSYALVGPFPDFKTIPRSELKAYFERFLCSIPQRMQELSQSINETSGFESWCADYSAESLDELGRWLVGQVETRNRSPKEIEDISRHSPYPIEVPKEELTERTFSVAFDVGIYLAQVFRQNYPSLQWKQVLESKKSINYGRPVLDGFGKLAFDPIHLVTTLAYGMASKQRDSAGLRGLYDVWSRMMSKTES